MCGCEAGRIHALGNNLGLSNSFSLLKADHMTTDHITLTLHPQHGHS